MARSKNRSTDPDEPELVQVNIRLFADDVEYAKQVAELERIPWHQKIRAALHEGLTHGKKRLVE